jgi:tetratricopeptide (TPR) repeat protein
MPDKPSFIVDPDGNVRDVRGQNSAQASPPPAPRPEPASPTPGTPVRSGSVRRTPGGIILIPIGLILTIIFAVFRNCGGPGQKKAYPESDVNLLNSALFSYDEGDYQMALINFNMVIRSQPEMGEAYNDRGLTYEAMGETENALADYTRAIELLPEEASAYSNRGCLYLFLGNHEQALADLNKAIELSPRLAKAYHNRGLTYLDQGDYDHAINDFTLAIAFTPESMFSMQATLEKRMPTGTSLLGSGYFTSLTNRQTYANLPKVYASRAMAYLLKGDHEKAAADLEKAVQLGLDEGIAQQIGALSPVSTSGPPSGYWQGRAAPVGVPATVSFDIGADGQIYDFILGLAFASGSSCQVTAYYVSVLPDGEFSFTFDTPGIETGITITGKFESNTMASGTFSGYIQCITSTGELINGGQSFGDPWKAQWVSGP